MSATPRVSVLMPVFEPRPEYLRAAIDSIRNQTVDDWELVIVDDAPASSARDIIRAYADTRIVHVPRSKRFNLADALNQGIALCSAPLVARLDGDDIARRDRLERQVVHFDAHPDTAVLGSSLAIINEAGEAIGHRRLPVTADDVARTLRRYNCIAHPSVMFRRDAVLAAGGYSTQFSPEDYDLWCRLSKAGRRIENLADELVLYRYHEAALKFSDVHGEIRRTIATKRRYFADDFTVGDRLRIAGELALLALPQSMVLRLFRMLTYGSSR